MTVGEDVIVGVLSSIVYDGVKRPFKGVIETVARRKHINRALSQSSPEHSSGRVSPAIQDLQRVLGNDHNAYSDDVAAFLRQVDQSAIPDALKHFALCGHDAEDAYPAFELLYKGYEDLPFSSRALFDALNSAIKMQVEQSIEDKTMFEAVKALNRELASRITSLAACLRSADTIELPLPSLAFDAIKAKVARGIENANRQINVETTQGARRVNVKKLVIAARLKPVLDKQNIPSAHRDAQEAELSRSISYLSFRRSFNRAVILGDPGGGKSTLTQLLCFDLAHRFVLRENNPKYKRSDSGIIRLPLKLVLRTLERRQQQNPSYQIYDYLRDEIRALCDIDEKLADAFLRQLLLLGQAVLLFDGLDEVLEVGARRSMVTLVEQFTAIYASCPALVTSRIVGYNDAPLGDDYDILTLSRFNANEVKKFTEQLIRAIANEKAAEAKEKAARFLSQTESTAEDLRENPLLLGLMVYIFNSRGEVPSNRPEIYRECSLLMFEKWDQRRDIKFDFPHDFDLLDLFGFLATQIFGSADTEDGVDEQWLVSKLREYFDIWYRDRARSVAAARVLVEFITGRAWVMCEIGPGIYKFTHRTFLEYFFAKRLEEEAGSINALIQNHLWAKIIDAQWDVVSHLALQIATFRSGPKSVQAIESLLRVREESRLSPAEEMNFLLFFSKSLEYLLVPEVKVGDAAEYIFRRCLHIGANYDLAASDIIYHLIRATLKRAELVKDRLYEVGRTVLKGETSPDRSYFFYLLSVRSSRFSAFERMPRAENLVIYTYHELKTEWQGEQFNRAKLSLAEARNFIIVYADKLLDLYKIHGIDLLFLPSSALVPFEVSHLGTLVAHQALLLIAGGHGPNFKNFHCGRDELAQTLIEFTDFLLNAWKQGNLDDRLPPANDEARSGVINEFMAYVGYVLEKRRTNLQTDIISRCLFAYIMEARSWEDTMYPWRTSLTGKRTTRRGQILRFVETLGPNPFTDAVVAMLKAGRS